MKKTTGSKLLTIVTTAIVCTAMLWLPARQSSAGVVLMDQLTGSLVDSQAAKYTRAVSDLGAIVTMSLKTEADFKQASSIINDQTKNLRFVKYRIVQIALSNAVFIGAVRGELTKTKGDGDAVLQRFRQNPAALTSLNGAQSAQQRIKAELKRDFENIKAASEHIQNSAAAIRNRRVSAPAAKTDEAVYSRVSYYAPPAIDDYFEALFAASTIVAGVRAGDGGGGSSRKLPRSESEGGSSGGSSSGSTWAQDEQDYHDCARQAGEKRDRCKGNCGPGLFQWLCLGNCDASYMLTKASCLVSSLN
jgi:hypothetical protein